MKLSLTFKSRAEVAAEKYLWLQTLLNHLAALQTVPPSLKRWRLKALRERCGVCILFRKDGTIEIDGKHLPDWFLDVPPHLCNGNGTLSPEKYLETTWSLTVTTPKQRRRQERQEALIARDGYTTALVDLRNRIANMEE